MLRPGGKAHCFRGLRRFVEVKACQFGDDLEQINGQARLRLGQMIRALRMEEVRLAPHIDRRSGASRERHAHLLDLRVEN